MLQLNRQIFFGNLKINVACLLGQARYVAEGRWEEQMICDKSFWYLQYYYESYRQDSTQSTSTQRSRDRTCSSWVKAQERKKPTPHSHSAHSEAIGLVFGIVHKQVKKIFVSPKPVDPWFHLPEKEDGGILILPWYACFVIAWWLSWSGHSLFCRSARF
jgi:hypothetical protein